MEKAPDGPVARTKRVVRHNSLARSQAHGKMSRSSSAAADPVVEPQNQSEYQFYTINRKPIERETPTKTLDFDVSVR